MIEDDCYFLGVHMRLSARCKILFTLGQFANYFSLKSLSLSLKSHMNVLCALKLTELWNTSLLFDLNYKYIMGASLLALAKSIYYSREKFYSSSDIRHNVAGVRARTITKKWIYTGDLLIDILSASFFTYLPIIKEHVSVTVCSISIFVQHSNSLYLRIELLLSHFSQFYDHVETLL